MITENSIREFEAMLRYEEKAEATVEKYVTAVRKLAQWLQGRELEKTQLLQYREALLQYKQPQTVNGDLSAINSYLDFMGLAREKVHFLKIQRQTFLKESRELTEQEYKRLLNAAKRKGNERLYLLMMTICSTGIRVGELRFITAEAARKGKAEIRLKGKCRRILLPRALCKKLLDYAKKQGIGQGYLFRTRSGNPLDRTNIGHEMKALCKEAQVETSKVFPHNLRHLFARCFIAIEGNLAHLADVLGHSRIETTRIYVTVSESFHTDILKKMRLVI